jgi:6-phosphogluconolactonase
MTDQCRRVCCLCCTVLLTSLAFIAGTPQGQCRAEDSPSSHAWVFVGTYTRGASEGVYVLQLDLTTGSLKKKSVAVSDNPSFLAIHPNGKYVYAANEISNYLGKSAGAISAFSFDRKTGRLSLLNQQSSGGAGPCHLVVDQTGKSVLAANYGGGSVCSLPVGADGKLRPAATFIQHTGSSVNSRRQKEPHAHSINLDPSNRFAVAVDLGIDQLLIYPFDADKGMLTAGVVSVARVAPGSGPRHFAFHPSGQFAYVINELLLNVTVFAFDSKTGALTGQQVISTLPPGTGKTGSTAEVQVHPSGRFLYGSNRGHDSIVAYSIDQQTGRLTHVENESTGGRTPRNFGIDPTGRYLLAANQSTSNIVVFRIDQKTGELSPAGHEIEIPSPVCVKMMPVNQ